MGRPSIDRLVMFLLSLTEKQKKIPSEAIISILGIYTTLGGTPQIFLSFEKRTSSLGI